MGLRANSHFDSVYSTASRPVRAIVGEHFLGAGTTSWLEGMVHSFVPGVRLHDRADTLIRNVIGGDALDRDSSDHHVAMRVPYCKRSPSLSRARSRARLCHL
jgi:hypothetical protein